jgi:hypothetical protein
VRAMGKGSYLTDVLAWLRQRERRALFVTELVTALREERGVSASDVEQTLTVTGEAGNPRAPAACPPRALCWVFGAAQPAAWGWGGVR